MNAPEKIYLLHDDRYVDDLSIIWFEAPYATGSIEYVRTDVFIEKTCEWFRTLDDKEPPYKTTEEFIEEFKKAMML